MTALIKSSYTDQNCEFILKIPHRFKPGATCPIPDFVSICFGSSPDPGSSPPCDTRRRDDHSINLALPSCLKCSINTLQAPKAQPLLAFLLLLCSDTSCAEMNFLGITVALGLLGGICAQINVLRPACDSLEAEQAALVAQDYLNAQHNHGYKYALNRIEDIKVHSMVRQQGYTMIR